ncbi:hypothetical protein [Acinetobacter shaoyimingii]|uniref:Uncharacterized protein n=1 Tax=Acinetobacter shaoyimingii TaxID=2715164 RepID=A0A6G8RYK9_9GAMM|nr:hypothetical protein [Acinetobacter shaoyimingii]QIO06888.1 hypothetical protein G8E00_13525 [Acinetobacter shaoyimingii]
MTAPLTVEQKNKLQILEPKLEKAIFEKNIKFARELVVDIQNVLRPTGHYIRLIQAKNKFCELAIEMAEFDSIKQILESNIKVVNSNTRVYIETISLLAIYYLRIKDVQKAKEYIKEVLQNHTVIKTQRTRNIFHSEIIERFNQEVALATLTGFNEFGIDQDDVEREAIRIIQTLSNDEIYEQIGKYSPQSTKDMIYTVHDYSLKQLPYTQRIMLPSPTQKIDDKEVGVTIYEAVKRVLYNSMCNPESEIYKAWFTNGLTVFLDKKYILTTVISSLTTLGFGVTMIVPSLVALITKFGIEVYCEKNKPLYISQIRKI